MVLISLMGLMRIILIIRIARLYLYSGFFSDDGFSQLTMAGVWLASAKRGWGGEGEEPSHARRGMGYRRLRLF
jgi:hypothetical protein